jgi:hypothetical protein
LSSAGSAASASGLTSWKTGAPRSPKKLSSSSISASPTGANSPRPNVCVQGEATPSNIAYAPATSIHRAPLAGKAFALDSTNAALARASARSRRRESARSESGNVSSLMDSPPV